MAYRPVAPGDLVYRDRDKRMGVIVTCTYTHHNDSSDGWRFKILIDNVLIDTVRLGSDYTRVQTWA